MLNGDDSAIGPSSTTKKLLTFRGVCKKCEVFSKIPFGLLDGRDKRIVLCSNGREVRVHHQYLSTYVSTRRRNGDSHASHLFSSKKFEGRPPPTNQRRSLNVNVPGTKLRKTRVTIVLRHVTDSDDASQSHATGRRSERGRPTISSAQTPKIGTMPARCCESHLSASYVSPDPNPDQNQRFLYFPRHNVCSSPIIDHLLAHRHRSFCSTEATVRAPTQTPRDSHNSTRTIINHDKL